MLNIFSTLDKKFEKVEFLSLECSPCTYVAMEAGKDRDLEIERDIRERVRLTCLKVHLLRGGQNDCLIFPSCPNKQKTR